MSRLLNDLTSTSHDRLTSRALRQYACWCGYPYQQNIWEERHRHFCENYSLALTVGVRPTSPLMGCGLRGSITLDKQKIATIIIADTR